MSEHTTPEATPEVEPEVLPTPGPDHPDNQGEPQHEAATTDGDLIGVDDVDLPDVEADTSDPEPAS